MKRLPPSALQMTAMSSLRDLQAAFVAGVFDVAHAGAQAMVRGGAMAPQARLAIYRNNIFHNYHQALRDVYPVVERLVGEDFFHLAARRYIPLHPSRDGNLHSFGAAFGNFLDGFPPAAQLPYLGDVARLEWHVHEAFHAADHAAMSLDRLGSVPPQQLPLLTFTLHPACRLLESRFPVNLIWQANQGEAGAEEAVDLDVGGVCLLLRRPGYAVEVEAVAAAEFGLLSALSQGLPLRQALERAFAASPDFDLAAFLRQRIGDATVVTCAIFGS